MSRVEAKRERLRRLLEQAGEGADVGRTAEIVRRARRLEESIARSANWRACVNRRKRIVRRWCELLGPPLSGEPGAASGRLVWGCATLYCPDVQERLVIGTVLRRESLPCDVYELGGAGIRLEVW